MKKNINTSDFWNYQNIKNEELLNQSKIYKHKHKIVLKWLGKKDGSLLNIGVGNGYLEKLLLFKKSLINLFGIDIADISIRKIKEQINGKFKIANITKIPFGDDMFDFITALDILEHLDHNEIEVGLSEIRRVLKPNGILIISVPLNEKNRDRKANRHLISFSKKSMLSKLRQNKFRINEVKELFAFNKLYWLKTAVSKLFFVRKPNLLLIKSTKSIA